ncbi:MAG: hypothetical protein JO356_07510 [Acidobacteria bacterium]|nr:hypothetical protein [Acidobacteriota bacterium]
MQSPDRTSGFRRPLTVLLAALLATGLAKAQSNQNPGLGGVGDIHHGLVVGVIVGVAAVAGVGITYLVLRQRGVAVGCVAESNGKRSLVTDKVTYSLSDIGPTLPAGERVKLKGHKSGPSSSPSFEVKKVLKNYGHCQP